MSLKEDIIYWGGSSKDIMPTVDRFAQAKRRMDEKEQKIKDLQNEFDLLETQAYNLYKDRVEYLMMPLGYIDAVREWLQMQEDGVDKEGNKLDKRKNYAEKSASNFFIDYLQGLLGIDDMVAKKVITFGYDEGSEIIFTSHGHKWQLYIPNVKKVSLITFRDMGDYYFKLGVVHYDSEHCMSTVGTTFNEDDLKEIMANGIAKYCTVDVS